MIRFALLTSASAVLVISAAASAHPGGLNREGCHNNRKTGDYHCHRGPSLPALPALPRYPATPVIPQATAPQTFLATPTPSNRDGWLLVAVVIDGDSGELRPTQVHHKSYATRTACDAAGQIFRSIKAIPDRLKSLSVCVSAEWFDRSGWQEEGTQ